MRRFSVRPAITLKGRTFKGLRGWAGKPFHPPLTDIPIAAYVLGAAFDVVSVVGGDDHGWGHDFWHAGTYMFVGGAAVSVLAALTGFIDWLRSSEAGTQARRTANTHAAIMVTVTVLTLVDVVLRLNAYNTEGTPSGPIGWHRDFAEARNRLREWVSSCGTRLDRDRPTRQATWPGEALREPGVEVEILDRYADFLLFVHDDVAARRTIENQLHAAS